MSPCAGVALHAVALVAIVCVACCRLGADPPDERPAAEAERGSLPLSVAVAHPVAYLRAGPGDDYYPTDRLDRGTSVEVWAIDPGGWCAIRPVEGSFSWVRAADIDEEIAGPPPEGVVRPGRGPAPRIGVVVADGAVARVGSQLNDLRHVAQVRLEAGERLAVLGRERVAEGRHAGLWLRIEPPAGEFRWIDLAALESSPRLRLAALEAGVGPARASAAPPRVEASEALEAFRSAGEAIALAVDQSAAAGEPQPLGAMPQARRMLTGWLPLGTGTIEAPPPVAVAAPPTSMADELADIDLALSLAVAGPADGWNLQQLRERLRLAAARTTAKPDRLRADAIDARIARFEAIQARQQAIAAGPLPDRSLRLGSMWSSLGGVGTRPIRPGVLPGGASADGKPTWTPPDVTETTGRLATVVSRRPDAPRWALVDGSNNVIVFVNPQPGVNLAPMVGQQVSVRGARGYMPEYKRSYLLATEARPRVAAVPQPNQGDLTR